MAQGEVHGRDAEGHVGEGGGLGGRDVRSAFLTPLEVVEDDGTVRAGGDEVDVVDGNVGCETEECRSAVADGGDGLCEGDNRWSTDKIDIHGHAMSARETGEKVGRESRDMRSLFGGTQSADVGVVLT